MSNNYNIDDILEEVRRKKEAQSKGFASGARSPDGQPAKKTAPAPFQLKGLTGEFEAPAAKKAPNPEREKPAKRKPPAARGAGDFPLEGEEEVPYFSPAKKPERRRVGPEAPDEGFTRLDLPARRLAEEDPSGSTRVIPTVREGGAQQELEERRKEKIKEFMKSSFASLDGEEDGFEEEDETGSIERFFGGLPHGMPDEEEEPKNKKERRQKKDRRQSVQTPPISDGPSILEEEEDEPTEDEYITPSQARQVASDIKSIKFGVSVRFILTGACFFASLYLSLCNVFLLPIPKPIWPENDMRLFIIVNLAVLILSTLASNAAIAGGLISLFTLKADQDTPAAVAALATIAQGVAMVATPNGLERGGMTFYFSVAALGLWFNAIGKHMMISRLERNFAVASADAQLTGLYVLEENQLARALTHGQNLDDPVIAYSAKVGFPDRFLELSYTDDYSENLSRITAPLFLAFGVVVSAASYLFFEKDIILSLIIFNAMMCVASPLSTTLIGNLPLQRASKRLSGEGAFISGYDAVERFEDMNAVLLDATDLYPAGSVVLHGIKSFAESRIDETILDAASVMCSADGLLKDIFLQMIGSKTSILKPVEGLVYEDGAGVCAAVGGKPVLIGNRELMAAHGVDMPSKDYEKKFVKEGQDILYLANSGEVTAMFVLSYQVGAEESVWLSRLAKKGMTLVVYATDPNITGQKIAADFGYPDELVKVVSARDHGGYLQLTAPRGHARAYAMTLGGSAIKIRLLAMLGSLKQSIVLGTALQLAGLILGYGLIAFLSFTGKFELMGFPHLLAYQLIWTVIAVLLPNLRKL